MNTAPRTERPGERSSPVAPSEPRDPARVLSTEPWTFDGKPGRILHTPTHRIATTHRDATTLHRLPLFLSAALAHARTAFGPLPPPPHPLETYVLTTHDEWRRLTRRLLGDDAGPYLLVEHGGLAWGGRSILFGAPKTLWSAAAHEGWHQYTQATFREPLPVWLEEGLATFMEGHRWTDAAGEAPIFTGWDNPERLAALRAGVIHVRLLPLEDLLTTSPLGTLAAGSDQALVYYAQVWALIRFLREHENGVFRRPLESLIADAAAGRLSAVVASSPAARGWSDPSLAVFAAYFTPDLDIAAAVYESFIRDLARSGLPETVLSGPSAFR